MNWNEARDRLSRITAAAKEPKLTREDLDLLLIDTVVRDFAGIEPDRYRPWRPSMALLSGDIVVPNIGNGHYYEVTTAGSTGAAEPTWPTSDASTVNDNGVVFTETGSTSWSPTFNLAAAAAAGWLQKAGQVSDSFSFSADGSSFSPQQVHEHCMKQYEIWSARANSRESFGMVEVQVGSRDPFDADVIGNVNCG